MSNAESASSRKSVSLAESEARGEELRNRLRQQLKATQKLSRLLDEADTRQPGFALPRAGKLQIRLLP